MSANATTLIREALLAGEDMVSIASRLNARIDFVRRIRSGLLVEGMIGMFNAGDTFKAIAAAVGVSRNTVAGTINRAGKNGAAVSSRESPIIRTGRPPKRVRPKGPRSPAPVRLVAIQPIPSVDLPTVPLPPPGGVDLDTVQLSGGCRWPLTAARPHFFCGALRFAHETTFIADPMPYCARHRDIGASPKPRK